MPERRKPAAARATGRARAQREPSTSFLVPLDRTETSASVLIYAIELARALNARLALLTVLDESSSAGERKAAEQYISAIAQGLANQGVAQSVRVSTGEAATQIAEAASAEACELIVMTPHARPDGAPSLLGGTADSVVRSTAVPVMLMRPENVRETLSQWTSPPPFIVGLDGSALAATVLRYAASFVRRLGSELVLVRAIEPALPLGGAASYYQSPSDIAMNYLREVAEGVRDAGLKVSCEVLLGPAEKEIVKAAGERPGAVIALCTRGYSGRKDWILGSITDRVVRSTTSPVLVIPPAAAQ